MKPVKDSLIFQNIYKISDQKKNGKGKTSKVKNEKQS